MIAIVEPFCVGLEHVAVNAAIIDTVCRAYPDEAVCIFAEQVQLEELRRVLGDLHAPRIQWHQIEVPDRYAPFAARLLPEMRVLRDACCAGGRPSRLCVLLSAHRSTLWAAKALATLGLLRTPLQVILHGAVSEVAGWRSRNPLVRMWDMRSTLAFCAAPLIQYVVLEESIALALRQRMPQLAGNLAWISHPIPGAEISDETPPPRGPPVRIAFVGLASEAKGFPVFVRLADAIRAGFADRVEFHALGMLQVGALATTPFPALTTQPERAQLPRPEFLARLRTMHYVCLPFQTAHYELAASGALLDAVAQAKPIIALATPALRRLFEMRPDIGYLCESEQEMMALVRRLVANFPVPEYERQVEAMKVLRTTRLPDALVVPYLQSTRALLGASAH